MTDNIRGVVTSFLQQYKGLMDEMNVVISRGDMDMIVHGLVGDVEAKMEQDPVSRSPDLIFCSNSFKAICTYRIANHVYSKKEHFGREDCELFAYKISEESAARTTIEINPFARIGKAFVIDHGINTVIGATAEIGDCCTILQNVVLGSRKVAYNTEGKRHPTIGNHVQIAGGVSILGPVTVGNHVFIGPGCTIVEDIPDFARVKLMKSVLITSYLSEKS